MCALKKFAIMYDFDKTLSTKDMQEFSLLEKLGYHEPSVFWQEVAQMSQKNKMDKILTYLYLLLNKSRAKASPIKEENFIELGKQIEFYPGVLEWFEHINEVGKKYGYEIEHYIISSGMQEIIEGTSIYNCFKRVYACRYFYDENGVASWPARVVNYTTKTQYVFRINKQILNEDEDDQLNQYIEYDQRPIPFTRMIYIGDGLTDIPCMKLVKEYGGHAIAVYDQKKEVARQLMSEHRAQFALKADYSQNGEIHTVVESILNSVSAKEKLMELAKDDVK